MPAKRITASAARQTFFDLFNAVTTHRGRKVVITSRGVAAHAVLVDESYLEGLEAAARQLRDLQRGKGQAPRFRLVGSLRLAAEAGDDPLAALRATARKRADRKLSSFGKR